MNVIRRRIPIIFSLCLVWILASGFEDLEETTAGIGSVMDDLTGEDFEKLQIEDEWQDKVLADVDEYVTVRSEPDAESKALGRMFKGDGGSVIERLDGWTLVQSGNVEGYVNNEYLLFGLDAYEQAQEEVTLVATSLTGGLRIRAEGNTEAKMWKRALSWMWWPTRRLKALNGSMCSMQRKRQVMWPRNMSVWNSSWVRP